MWRDVNEAEFLATVDVAAETLDIQPLAVEKDYWVCQALRAIVSQYPGQVVFKGGTSLEKLGLIRRFSEDLDLLVVTQYETENAAKRALKGMCQAAAAATSFPEKDPKSGGVLGAHHRRAYLQPPLQRRVDDTSAIADANSVLVELGQSGGPHPARPHMVTSMLAQQLADAGQDLALYADLAPFSVDILHPGRTLLEKLLRVNNFAHDPDGAVVHGWARIGRQFYDIWALLGNDDVKDLLADSDLVQVILLSCYEVSEAFTRDYPPPTGGFANSLVFAPRGRHAARLRTEHDKAMRELYYGNTPAPTFDDVVARVAEHATLLRCGQ